jgi:hypothetical protein
MLQVVHLSLALVQFYLAILTQQGHSGAVITSVLKPVQALNDDGTRLAFPDITNNSTHNL